MIASIDSNRIITNIIIATLEEAQSAFPDETWSECPAWVGIGDSIDTPKPPYWGEPTADENKATASSLLSATDWTTIADVGNPQMSNPYLANQAEFIAYRNQVRQYAVYPQPGTIDWPTIPTENWVQV